MFDGIVPQLAERSPRTGRSRPLLVADLFCGAGGSSTGAQRALSALGFRMDLVCVNHWPVAIETHRRNHPEARHYCQDVATVRPHIAVPDGRLDLLMASPTCTFHSRARGGKPISDQQRMDPWHIVTWLTELRVRAFIIENVPEYMRWGPVNARTGRPLKRREGEYFLRWVETIRGLGFKVLYGVLNCANYGDPTTRERFFMIGRSDGKPLDWPEATHARGGRDADLLGAGRKPWRTAREIIDWGIRGRSIFDRKRPLSPKTIARIYAGAVKFRWPEPFIVVLRNHMAAQGLDVPLPTITAGGTHLGLAEPVIIRSDMQGGNGLNIRSADEPLFTVTTNGGLGIVEPFIQMNRENNVAKGLDEPLPAITTSHGGAALLVEPFVATVAHGNEACERNPDQRRCRSLDEPLQTIHAGGGKFALVEPFVLSQASGGAPRSVDEPVPTITTGGAGGAHALIAPYYGSGSGETCGSVEAPLPTVTTKARFGLAEPVLLPQRSDAEPSRTVGDPLPTITGVSRIGIVMPVTHGDAGNRARSVDEPLPTVTCARRGELAFITAAFGERDGQTPRVHPIGEPVPTICARGRVNFVEPGRDFDILFRMLEPHELAAAMGFTDDESRYEFVGNKTEVTKQIGNAVPVNTAAALVHALFGGRA